MSAPVRHGTLREQLIFHKWPEAEARAKALEILDVAEALAVALDLIAVSGGDVWQAHASSDVLARWRELAAEVAS